MRKTQKGYIPLFIISYILAKKEMREEESLFKRFGRKIRRIFVGKLRKLESEKRLEELKKKYERE